MQWSQSVVKLYFLIHVLIKWYPLLPLSGQAMGWGLEGIWGTWGGFKFTSNTKGKGPFVFPHKKALVMLTTGVGKLAKCQPRRVRF